MPQCSGAARASECVSPARASGSTVPLVSTTLLRLGPRAAVGTCCGHSWADLVVLRATCWPVATIDAT
eukprot:2180578-Rhodomonas_salina.4